jgi:hypothetical protein
MISLVLFFRKPGVTVHLPFKNNIVYIEEDDLEEIIENPNNTRSKLTAWLEANA